MIRINNLTKIYKSKKKEKCIALDNISFTLEDKGFVFIIGKSGSGKTTLLSILGGLESLTSGDIIVNDHHFKKFRNNTYVNYRNSMVGYIFQDFHLIDELTVYENIKISLDLQNKKDDNDISLILDKVGLKGYENRYPNELSGGEKQRIAIARALIKNPKVILADEPTGNLDSKTTLQILTLLKELSNERLVIIVSHNLNDARTYADRIIELSNGKIINDLKRNEEYSDKVKLVNNNLIIPVHKKLNEKENEFINERLSSGKIKKIIQVDNVFIDNEQIEYKSNNNYKISKNHYSLKNLFKLSLKFLKKDAIRLFLYSFVVAALIVILGLSQLIVNFDSSKVIQKELSKMNYESISLYKEDIVDSDISINKNCIIPIEENDINKFYEAGYEGDIYELVNIPLDYGSSYLLAESHMYNRVSYNDIYLNGTRGTLIASEEYLTKTFGTIEYIALSDEIKDGGIYITDYSADAMLFYKNNPNFKDYNSLLGMHKSMNNNYYAYINGIIKTNYKQKYKDIYKVLIDITTTKEEMKDLVKTNEYKSYYDDVVQNLNVSYTTNSNFKKDFIDLNSRTWIPVGNSTLTKDNEVFDLVRYVENGDVRSNYSFNDDEIIMSYTKYNEIFNTNYNSLNYHEFTPVEVSFTYYYFCDLNKEKAVYTVDLTITKLIDGNVFYVSDKVFKELMEINNITIGLYFDDLNDVSLISDVATKNGFIMNSVVTLTLTTVIKAVTVFSSFFSIIFTGLCICAFLILVNYGIKLVKERKYEIGILKALGIRDIDVGNVFGVQIITVILSIICMYIIGSILFIDLSNDILIKSLMGLVPDTYMIDIDVLFLNEIYICRNCILILLIVLLSFIIPLIKLRQLKPLDIVKAKE